MNDTNDDDADVDTNVISPRPSQDKAPAAAVSGITL